MGFNVSFGKTANEQSQRYISWILTGDGRRWVDSYAGPTTPRSAVLTTLATLGGSATVEDIAKYSKLGKDTVDYQLSQASPTLVRRKKSGDDQNYEQRNE